LRREGVDAYIGIDTAAELIGDAKKACPIPIVTEHSVCGLTRCRIGKT